MGRSGFNVIAVFNGDCAWLVQFATGNFGCLANEAE